MAMLANEPGRVRLQSCLLKPTMTRVRTTLVCLAAAGIALASYVAVGPVPSEVEGGSALWFPAPGRDLIYVISALDGLERIRPRQWLDSTEFVSHLAGEAYVRGIVDDRRRSSRRVTAKRDRFDVGERQA